MPTGYTAPIYEGEPITFRQFALRCSRGMMALVTLRDESLDAEIPPKLVPNDYYEKEITRLKSELAAAEAMSAADAEREAAEAYDAEVRQRAETERRRIETRDRYAAMLAQVETWKPPTTEHEGLKKFMAEQIRESMQFDCGEYTWPEPVRRTGAQYKAEQIDALRERIARREADLAEERRRCDIRNAWLSALRESLPKDGTHPYR